MNTEQLVECLCAEVPRLERHALVRRVGSGIVSGCAATLALVVIVLGTRADLRVALHGFSFWMKVTYTLMLGIGAAYAVTRLARPVPGTLRGLWLLAVPVLILAGLAGRELALTPSKEWLALWLGQSWMICPWLVLTLSAPIFVGLLWSFRRFAPAGPRAAGAAAGLAAGAWAATLYGLHCPEATAVFVLTWYSFGMLLTAGTGALLGPRLLRW